jgi:hypothetical protein
VPARCVAVAFMWRPADQFLELKEGARRVREEEEGAKPAQALAEAARARYARWTDGARRQDGLRERDGRLERAGARRTTRTPGGNWPCAPVIYRLHLSIG